MESATRQVRRLAALVPLLLIGTAHAQGLGPPDLGVISYLNDSTGTAATFVSPQNPLPTTATFTGSIGSVNTALNATSTLPTLTPGVQDFQGSLAGAAYMQPVFGSASGGGTIVDATHPLPVTAVSVSGGDLSADFGSNFPTAGEAAGVHDPNGNMNWLSIDGSGALIVGAPSAHPVNVNLVSGGGGDIASDFGSVFPPAGEAAGARDANGNMSWLSLDSSGSLLVSITAGGGGGDISSAFGTAFPPAGEASGFRDPNGNMHYGSVDLGGLFQVGNPVWTVVGPGTGLTAQRIAISSDPADNTVTIAQNPLTVIGTVNQGAPAVPANQWPMTLYTGINQLAIDGSGQISCSNCGGSSSGPAMDMVIGPTALSSSGTATLAVGSQGTGATTIVLTASSGLTAIFEGLTPAGWSAVAMDNTATGQTVSGATADGIFQTNSAGYSQVRVNVQAGTTTASLESSAGSIPTGVDSAIYMATPPSLSDGTPAGMTMTSDARLRVSLDTAAPTDRSGSIAAGGTSQNLAASNANRRRIKIQNPCSATSQGISTPENLFIRFNGAASVSAGNSIELLPCGAFDSGSGPVEASAVTVNASTTAHQYFAVEQ